MVVVTQMGAGKSHAGDYQAMAMGRLFRDRVSGPAARVTGARKRARHGSREEERICMGRVRW